MTENSFEKLGLSQPWLDNLDALGFVEMTPIQAQALPVMLGGSDVIGQAATGTGKTAAFGLALLVRIVPASAYAGALVLCPTRELAAQVAEEIRKLARPLPNTNVVTLTGGTAFSRQSDSLKRGADVVVGTPGRVLDHVRRGTLELSRVKTLVLDEADRMLDMGFVDDVSAIIEATPAWRQTLLFSATISEGVRALSERFQRQAEFIAVSQDEASPDITQVIYDIGRLDRTAALRRVLAHYQPASAVIFCNERETVDKVAGALERAGYSVNALHGGMEQHERDNVLLMFSNASLRLLVATNVAARGLDIEELDAVINYELPRDTKEFVHRVGRTGRAGLKGVAISLTGGPEARKRESIGELLEGIEPRPIEQLPNVAEAPLPAAMKTIVIQGGRRDKLRPGDIVGALTGDLGVNNDAIGRIIVGDRFTHVAIEHTVADQTAAKLKAGKIKGRSFRAYILE
ncbi:MAG: ATP-dependent RNA helicase DbpA [Bradymonadaceae bacterium]|nr:ATP-dependent RNA helicase DbpA [Lujinxingiaceae bacterium]